MTKIEDIIKLLSSCLKLEAVKEVITYEGDIKALQNIDYSAFIDKNNKKYYSLQTLLESNCMLIILEFCLVNWHVLKHFRINKNAFSKIKKDEVINFKEVISQLLAAANIKSSD